MNFGVIDSAFETRRGCQSIPQKDGKRNIFTQKFSSAGWSEAGTSWKWNILRLILKAAFEGIIKIAYEEDMSMAGKIK